MHTWPPCLCLCCFQCKECLPYSSLNPIFKHSSYPNYKILPDFSRLQLPSFPLPSFLLSFPYVHMYVSEIFLNLFFVLLSIKTNYHDSLVSIMQMFYYCYFIWKGLACFSRLYVLSPKSCPTFCDPMDCSPPGSSVHGDSPGKITGVGCHALLQGIFLIQGSNPGLPHCRWILYHLSH